VVRMSLELRLVVNVDPARTDGSAPIATGAT
jgi:hypothetical protein